LSSRSSVDESKIEKIVLPGYEPSFENPYLNLSKQVGVTSSGERSLVVYDFDR
jgi:hypothetical protein